MTLGIAFMVFDMKEPASESGAGPWVVEAGSISGGFRL